MRAEIWAVLAGFELAIRYNCLKIIVESDSLAVISKLKVLQVDDKPVCNLLQKIGRVLCHFSSIEFVHVYREANSCADALANYSLVQEEDRVEFDSPPVIVNSLLFSDCMGTVYPRLVLIQE